MKTATRTMMMNAIYLAWNTGTARTMHKIYALQDGYGEQGLVPPQGYDWSGIRDSSDSAVEQMYACIQPKGKKS